MESHEEGKKEQERLCAQTFLNWLGSQRGTKYKLQRAEEPPDLKGRWDFVAQAPRNNQWIALEVKRLVLPQSLKQFNGWSIFCDLLTAKLREYGTVKGSYNIFTIVPWAFNQKKRGEMVEAFADILSRVAAGAERGKPIDIGLEIASRFSDWPATPDINMQLWSERGICEAIQEPKEVFVTKLRGTGCSVIFTGGALFTERALKEAIIGIFQTKNGKSAKPNEQLGEARFKGATETFLLLDSHNLWEPDHVTWILSELDWTLLSNIDAIYLVDVHNSRVKEVWHSSGKRHH